ncbi:PIR protein, putative [Plasmodium sp.]|nr:PIR protein, putative [Plasmodium sp.]
MKVQNAKILLFSLPLNILEYNNNKPYIIPHTSIRTSRVLSECDLYMPQYNNDPHMKCVKEIFDRQTSRRLEEFEERMITQRKKCKEQRDKDIEKIILKDKMEKSLTEKVEKGCLRCGCGLGGVAAGVGIFGAIAVNELKKTALLDAAQKGIKAGISKAIFGLENAFRLEKLDGVPLQKIITEQNFKDVNILGQLIQNEYNRLSDLSLIDESSIFSLYEQTFSGKSEMIIKSIAGNAKTAAMNAGAEANRVTEIEIAAVETTSTDLYFAIAYSVIAILIIVLIMVIIYLILRYRRKKKLNKKLQYTKLLNQ